jgi:hypothetical protein
VSASEEVEKRPGAEAGGSGLALPVAGIETELLALVDGERVDPERYWTTPAALMGPSPLQAASAAPLAGGGVLYFDQGVLEIVTPVIELGEGASVRVARSVWEQIAQVRGRLDRWSSETMGGPGGPYPPGFKSGDEFTPAPRNVRLTGWSTHYNVSFDPPATRDPHRTVEKLALLLAHVLPLPVALVGANRRSTGIGVRPRGNRIEVTTDFTPDPGLMAATATLVLGVVRGAMALPSYDLEVLSELPLPTVAGVLPGKHSSRTGWLTRDYHYPRSPFLTSVDARVWTVRDGRRLSLRAVARETAWFFRRSIREHSDPFSFRLLFSVLEGRTPSMLELPDRPAAYEDVGRASRWGEVLPELRAHPRDARWAVAEGAGWATGSFELHVADRARARARYLKRRAREARRAGAARLEGSLTPPPNARAGEAAASSPPPTGAYRGDDRREDRDEVADGPDIDRRRRPAVLERRVPPPSRRAAAFPQSEPARSRYEEVFQRLVAGVRVRLGADLYRPARMRGWYHAAFVRESDGSERVLSLDELLGPDVRWMEEAGGG